MTPFCYRGRVLGIAAHERALAIELQRVRKLGQKNRANVADPEKNSLPGVWYNLHDDDVNLYGVGFVFFVVVILLPGETYLSQSRFDEGWERHLPAKFDVCSIQELIYHTIDEGNRLFVETRYAYSWLIYALPQRWEKGAQEYIVIVLHGFADRQWLARGATNFDVAENYRNWLMGDIMEMILLDSSLFCDLIEKVALIVISTANQTGDVRYTKGAPAEAWRAMIAA